MYTGCRICSLSHPITAQTTSREREIFSNHFSYKTWLTLPEKEQKTHTLLKCETCTNLHNNFSELHVSFIKNQKQIYEACENLTEHVISKFKKNNKSKVFLEKRYKHNERCC